MYFFYHPTTRKIISATAMGLSPEDLATLQPPGSEVIEEDIDNLPNWRGELADYYVSHDAQILKANTYMEFLSSIKLQSGQTYSWTVIDENTQVYEFSRGLTHSPSLGEEITFSATDPGVYKFELSSKTYKTAIIVLEVTL